MLHLRRKVPQRQTLSISKAVTILLLRVCAGSRLQPTYIPKAYLEIIRGGMVRKWGGFGGGAITKDMLPFGPREWVGCAMGQS